MSPIFESKGTPPICWFKLVPISAKEGQELLTADYDAERVIKFHGYADDVVRATNNFDQMLRTLKLCFEEWPEKITPCYGELKAALALAEGR